jgi:tetratricopeptide (TPR) repeat protein
VQLGDLARPNLTREQRARQAIERLRRLLKENPNAAWVHNDLAWTYLSAPAALRDVEAALPLAEQAVRLAPKDWNYRNTLGVANYRAGRYREAVALLRDNVEQQADRILAYDLYFLAMCHHRLDEPERARDYYTWAVRWVAAQTDLRPDSLEELTVIRAEAEELLGVGR